MAVNQLLLQSLPLGVPPDDWDVVYLRDVTSKIGSGATPRGGEKVYQSHGVSLIRSQNVYEHEFHKEGLVYINDDEASKLGNVIVQSGDVLLNITGDSIARCCIVPDWVLPARVNQHVVIIRPTENLKSAYLQKYLSHPKIKDYMLGHDAGGTRKALTKGNIEGFLIPLPPLPEQRAIAHILGTLDDKIELNQQMNQTLEAIARAIFKSWFVDFDPVRAKMEGRQPARMDAANADLFPDEFDDSQMGKIPQGWRVKKLSDLCTTQYGYTASATKEPIGSKFLRVMDINKRNWIEWESVPHCVIGELEKQKYALEVGDLVVARMADPGKSAIIEQPIDAVFASYLVRLKTCSLAHAYFLYGFLKSRAYAEYSEGAVGGSVQKNMNAKVIVGADVLIPSDAILDAYLNKVLPLRKCIVANVEQANTLATLRDTLLPKLLSGEIRVRDAATVVEVVT